MHWSTWLFSTEKSAQTRSMSIHRIVAASVNAQTASSRMQADLIHHERFAHRLEA